MLYSEKRTDVRYSVTLDWSFCSCSIELALPLTDLHFTMKLWRVQNIKIDKIEFPTCLLIPSSSSSLPDCTGAATTTRPCAASTRTCPGWSSRSRRSRRRCSSATRRRRRTSAAPTPTRARRLRWRRCPGTARKLNDVPDRQGNWN